MRSLWSHGLRKMNFRKGHLFNVVQTLLLWAEKERKMSQNQKDRPQVHACDTNKNQQTARGNDRIICTERSVSQRVPFERLKFSGMQHLKPEFRTPKLMKPKLDTRSLTLTFAGLYISSWCSLFHLLQLQFPEVCPAPVKLWLHHPSLGCGELAQQD